MNPNLSTKGCENMERHAKFVWQNYVKDSGFEHLCVIAHSAGGHCVQELIEKFNASYLSQVKQTAFTDTWVAQKNQLNEATAAYMAKSAIHYIKSPNPLGTPERMGLNPSCTHLSAGHPRHEFTTGTSWPLIQVQFENNGLE